MNIYDFLTSNFLERNCMSFATELLIVEGSRFFFNRREVARSTLSYFRADSPVCQSGRFLKPGGGRAPGGHCDRKIG